MGIDSSLSSALQAARQALYDLENPATPDNSILYRQDALFFVNHVLIQFVNYVGLDIIAVPTTDTGKERSPPPCP